MTIEWLTTIKSKFIEALKNLFLLFTFEALNDDWDRFTNHMFLTRGNDNLPFKGHAFEFGRNDSSSLGINLLWKSKKGEPKIVLIVLNLIKSFFIESTSFTISPD